MQLIGIENANDGNPATHEEFKKTAEGILGPYGYKQVDHIEYDYLYMRT